MSGEVASLVLALHAEHEQRTGHDVTKRDRFGPLQTEAARCVVCTHLHWLMERAGAEARAALRAPAPTPPDSESESSE